MLKELKLPELGENIESAVVGKLLVSPGDAVEKDQPVLEVETDKATAEVPSPFSGVVKEVRVKAGDEVRVGHVLLTLEQGAQEPIAESAGRAAAPPPQAASRAPSRGRDAERAAPPPAATDGPAPSAAKAAVGPLPAAEALTVAASPTPSPTPAAAGTGAAASPAVRRHARELGIDLSQVKASGSGGRISLEDVTQRARALIDSLGGAASAPAASGAAPPLPDFTQWGAVHREPLSGVRRKIAERLARAWSLVPHVTQFDQADITDLEALRKRWSGKAQALGTRLTITAIVLKIAASAVKIFPRFNSSIDPARQEIIYKDYVHVGVAVDAGHGLLTPVIRDADKKNILQIAVELGELSGKARAKKLTIEEMRGSSFTVSNLGGLGTTYFSPIVNWPEVAILGVGRAATQAIHAGGAFVPRLILPLSVSYDHRVIDGADAARFLRWIAEALEEPLKVVLEG
ncbi:MAG: 2-oxo acid dehydrogenase subunit E2 [Acidobacteriota bacterium]